MRKLLFLFLLILPAGILLGGEPEFPRVGAIYWIPYPANSIIEDLPSMVKVLARGTDAWYLVEYDSARKNISDQAHQMWINFNMLLTAEGDKVSVLTSHLTPNHEKPTGHYP